MEALTAHVKHHFSSGDSDGTGFLDQDELEALLKKLFLQTNGVAMDEAEAKRRVKEARDKYDTDGDGLDLNEFTEMLQHPDWDDVLPVTIGEEKLKDKRQKEHRKESQKDIILQSNTRWRISCRTDSCACARSGYDGI